MLSFESSFVVGSFSFLRIHKSKWTVLIKSLWNNFASRKVVLRALSACLVRCKFCLLLKFSWSSITAGFRISTFFLKSSKSISIDFRIEIAFPPPSLIIPSIKCSVPIKLCPSLKASSLLYAITSLTLEEKLSSIIFSFNYISSKIRPKF